MATFQRNFPAFRERGSVHGLEFTLIRKDGATFPVLVNATAARDADGRYVRSLSTMVDMSERERAERALRESEERYRSLFEDNHAVMLLINPESGAITDANPAACAWYGWIREEMLAMRIDQINTLSSAAVRAEMESAREEAGALLLQTPTGRRHDPRRGSLQRADQAAGQDAALLPGPRHHCAQAGGSGDPSPQRRARATRRLADGATHRGHQGARGLRLLGLARPARAAARHRRLQRHGPGGRRRRPRARGRAPPAARARGRATHEPPHRRSTGPVAAGAPRAHPRAGRRERARPRGRRRAARGARGQGGQGGHRAGHGGRRRPTPAARDPVQPPRQRLEAVSYTHLTLPTIYSV